MANIIKIQKLAKQLASIGKEVLNLWMIVTLLGNLLESYQTLMITLEIKEPSALTM